MTFSLQNKQLKKKLELFFSLLVRRAYLLSLVLLLVIFPSLYSFRFMFLSSGMSVPLMNIGNKNKTRKKNCIKGKTIDMKN